MKLGLYGINMGVCLDAEAISEVARAAEGAGFDSLWTAEHVVLPDPRTPESPIPAQTPLLDPAVALATAAAHTTSIRLATGIIILPQRNPAVLAKELASLDVLSGGRLIFGLGAGYIPAEFAALGASFVDRGATTDEYIEAIRTLWTEERPHYSGRFVSFAEIDAYPRPVQKPHPPIVVGGMSPPALRRAVRQGNGWYGFALDPEQTATCVAGLREAEQRVDRPDALGQLELSVTPMGQVDADRCARYAELGVDRLVLLGMARDVPGMVAFIERSAESLLHAG